ncbi:MAG: tetratricopeptide repeat protein [Bacteroidales bacterium]|nr:tetratricopeptide repeat protein [Bacteroidales bacterium]
MTNRVFKKIPLILILSFVCGITGLKAQTLDEAITATNNEQYDKADQILQDLAKKSPSSTVYYRLGENTMLNFFSDTISNSLRAVAAEAKQQFEKGVAINANDPLNYVGLAKVAAYLGDQQTAGSMREKAKSLLLPYKKVSKIPNPQEYALTLAKLAESYIVFDKVDTTKALPLVREAITIDPKNSTIYIITGDIYFLVNDGSKAIKNYGYAQDQDLNSPMANMKIGYIYVKGRNLQAAIPYYEQAIALDKNYAPAYRELGQLYSMAGRFDDSKKYFESYLELTNQNIPAKIRYVNALFYSKNYADVIKNVKEIFAVDQTRTYLNRVAGYSSYEQGNYAEALNYMNELFAKLSADGILKKDYVYLARIIVKKNADYAKDAVELEQATAELAKLRENNEALQGAKESERVSEEPLVAKIAELQNKVDMQAKELNQAFDAYEKAITFEDEDLNMIQEKANFQFANRFYADAADTWSRLLTKGKDSESNYLQIGRAYYQGKDYDKAEALFEQMISKYPDSITGYVWAANNASAEDPDSKTGIAREKFLVLLNKAATDSVKYANEMFDALRFLGYDALQSDQNDLAKDYYTRMLNLAPDNKDFQIRGYSSLSSLYLSTGDYTKAVEVNNKILAIDENNASAKSTIQYIQSALANAKPKAHPNEISGVIKDASGNPIAGASVRVRDTAAEMWTNSRGEYRFTMPEASKVLVISASGYTTKEVVVTKSRVYNVSLSK